MAESGKDGGGAAAEVAGFKQVTEGTATMLYPEAKDVFYNPVQQLNRDMSIAVLNRFSKTYMAERQATFDKKKAKRANSAKAKAAEDADRETAAVAVAVEGGGSEADDAKPQLPEPTGPPNLLIMEALSATGLRSVRYWNEIENVERVIANDYSAAAVELIRRNVVHNGIDPETEVVPSQGDATLVMHQHRATGQRLYDVVDLDPYGGANPFLDASVQSVAEGGMLCITCTDMAVLAGNHPEACFAKYASMPIRGKHCKESALRIMLSSVAMHAARYKRYIVPCLSLSIDFYSRIFVRVYTSANEVKKAGSKLSTVYSCTGCGAYHFQPLCKIETKNTEKGGVSTKFKLSTTGQHPGQFCTECGKTFQIGGPLWSDPIHDPTFVSELLKDVKRDQKKYFTFQKMNGMLSLVDEELQDCPLFYTTGALCGTLHCRQPTFLELRSAFLNAGHRVSGSHADADALKTDAPPSAVWDIMRSWVEHNPVKNTKPRSPAETILGKKATVVANFELHPDANPKSRAKGVVRYPDNPPNWGPKSRAKKRAATQGDTAAEAKVSGQKQKRAREDEAGVTPAADAEAKK